jgi:hypothetical protein
MSETLMNEPELNPTNPPPPSNAVSDAAKTAWDTTKVKAEEALHTGEKYVRENPGTSALGIFGLGFVLGLLVGWCIAHEERDSYAAMGRRWARKIHLD